MTAQGRSFISATKAPADLIMLTVVSALCLLLANTLPIISSDSAWYLVALQRWPVGELGWSYAIVGGRHFGLFVYKLLLDAFGFSIDGMMLAAASIFGVFGMGLLVLCRRWFGGWWAYPVFLATLLFAYGWAPWRSVLTDCVFFAIVVWVVALFRPDERAIGFANAFSGLLLGLLLSVRGESALLLLACLASFVWSALCGMNSFKKVALASVVFLVTTLGGSFLADRSRVFWLPPERPATMDRALLPFLVLTNLNKPEMGPASATVAQLSQRALSLGQLEPRFGNYSVYVFGALAEGRRRFGPAETEVLFFQALWETVLANPTGILGQWRDEMLAFLTGRGTFSVRTVDASEYWPAHVQSVRDFENARIAAGPVFDDDLAITFPDIMGAEEFANAFTGFPARVIEVHTLAPGSLQIVAVLVVCYVALRRPKIIGLAIPPILAALAWTMASTFSAGFQHRYTDPWTILANLAALAVLMRMLVETPRMRLDG